MVVGVHAARVIVKDDACDVNKFANWVIIGDRNGGAQVVDNFAAWVITGNSGYRRRAYKCLGR